jgi:hypothetical protein
MSRSSSVVTIADLRKHASKHEINLHGATTKKDILGHVKKHGSLNMVQHTKPISTKGKGSSKVNNKGSKGLKKSNNNKRHDGGGGGCSRMGMVLDPESDTLTNEMIEYTVGIRAAVKKLLVEESYKDIVKSGKELVKAAIVVDSIHNKTSDEYKSSVVEFDSKVASYLSVIKFAFRTQKENLELQAEYDNWRSTIIDDQNAENAPLIERLEVLKTDNLTELDKLMTRLENLKCK